jgi:hypothetical protein
MGEIGKFYEILVQKQKRTRLFGTSGRRIKNII